MQDIRFGLRPMDRGRTAFSGRVEKKETVVLKNCLIVAVLLAMVSTVGAQGPVERAEPADFLKGAAGDTSRSGSPFMSRDGTVKKKPQNLGTAQATKSEGIVIFSSNTGGYDEFFCTNIDEPFLYDEASDFWVQSTVVQSLVFTPSKLKKKKKEPDFLEIIWSGQINISTAPSPDYGPFDQQAFFRCTVTQKGESVPCSGTAWDPSFAQDASGDGLTKWVWYHGYVEMNAKEETTVELRLFATNDTEANACEDTMILKY
jgi:hypothetical protein